MSKYTIESSILLLLLVLLLPFQQLPVYSVFAISQSSAGTVPCKVNHVSDVHSVNRNGKFLDIVKSSHCLTSSGYSFCDVSEDIASKSTENCNYRPPLCRLTSTVQGTPANICISLILPETGLPNLHFWR